MSKSVTFYNIELKMRSISKFIVIVFMSIFVVSQVHAESESDFKTKFIKLGGSEDGYNKIIENVKTTQANNISLEKKIVEVYYPQLSKIMSDTNFNETEYSKIYNQIEQEKSSAIQQNLNGIIALLKTLSEKDRKAYASLLYGSDSSSSEQSTNNGQEANKDDGANKQQNGTAEEGTSSTSQGGPTDKDSSVANGGANDTSSTQQESTPVTTNNNTDSNGTTSSDTAVNNNTNQ